MNLLLPENLKETLANTEIREKIIVNTCQSRQGSVLTTTAPKKKIHLDG